MARTRTNQVLPWRPSTAERDLLWGTRRFGLAPVTSPLPKDALLGWLGRVRTIDGHADTLCLSSLVAVPFGLPRRCNERLAE